MSAKDCVLKKKNNYFQWHFFNWKTLQVLPAQLPRLWGFHPAPFNTFHQKILFPCVWARSRAEGLESLILALFFLFKCELFTFPTLIWDIIKTALWCVLLELLQQVLHLGVTISRIIPKCAPAFPWKRKESSPSSRMFIPTLQYH